MTYFPWGVLNGDVPDPDLLAQEYREAFAIASETTHLNWAAEGITDITSLESNGEHLAFYSTSASADTGWTDGHSHILPDDAGFDTNLWKVPYNSGWAGVGEGTTAGELEVTWESAYSQLVEVVADLQYVRDVFPTPMAGYSLAWGGVRLLIGIELDGVVQPGAIDAPPQFILHRGRGYAASALPFHQVFIGVVPPGSHRARVVACLAPVTDYDDDEKDKKTLLEDILPTEHVCIGSRTLSVTAHTRPLLAEG